MISESTAWSAWKTATVMIVMLFVVYAVHPSSTPFDQVSWIVSWLLRAMQEILS